MIMTMTGMVKDDVTLREMNVTGGAKMMVIGSTMGDVVTVQMSKQNADLDKVEAAAGKGGLKNSGVLRPSTNQALTDSH